MNLDIVTKEDLNAFSDKLVAELRALLSKNHAIGGKETIYDNQAACAFLMVCTKTLQNYRDNGLLRFTQIGRKIYYSKEDLMEFLSHYKKETPLFKLRNRHNNY